MVTCPFCKGTYASQGGVTRHLRICPERLRQISREADERNALTKEAEKKCLVEATQQELKEQHRLQQVAFERERKLQQEALERERQLLQAAVEEQNKIRHMALEREHKLLAELKTTRQVTNNFTNCTFNVTQQYITVHNSIYDTFCRGLTAELSGTRWTSVAEVRDGMKKLTVQIERSTPESRRFLECLRAPEVKVELDAQVDGETVVANLAEKVDEVDKQMVIFAKQYLPPTEQAKLDVQLAAKSIWELD